MRIIFMGSSLFACPALEAVASSPADELVAVVAQPDRPRGRRLQMAACPTKEAAAARGIPLLTPLRVNAPESVAALRTLAPDLVVVAAYGQILSREVLAVPPRGCINIHASLLPAYRGAAPIARAIVNGDPVTGVTIMQMNERMDAGGVLLQRATPIGSDDTAGSLAATLGRMGAELLREALDAVRAGTARSVPQDERAATLAPKLTKEEGRMDWALPAERLAARVRGFDPWPGCVCRTRGSALKVLKARAEPGAGAPGTVLAVEGDGPLVAAGSGALRLRVVQPAGRKEMSGSAFLRGHGLEPGDVIE